MSVLIGFSLWATTALPAVMIVTNEDDSGSGSLRAAISAANATAEQDEIQFASGVNHISLTSGQIEISEPLKIHGPAGSQVTVDAGSDSRIFSVKTSHATLHLANLNLANGTTYADGLSPATCDETTGQGGAVCSLAALFIDNCRIATSATGGQNAHGGGVYSQGSVTINNSQFVSNATHGSSSNGGALAVDPNANIRIGDSIFSSNGTFGTSSRGGAVRTGFYSAEMVRTRFIANQTNSPNSSGGAISAYGELTLTDSLFKQNATLASGSFGGALQALNAVHIEDSTFSTNSTKQFNSPGGAIYSRKQITLNNSLIINNETVSDVSDGGGIAASGLVEIENSLVSGNSTFGDGSAGGGVAAVKGIRVRNSTISNNSTSGQFSSGGGLYVDQGAAEIIHTTLTGNSVSHAEASGGAIISVGPATIVFSTITGNSSNRGAGGVEIVARASYDLRVYLAGSFLSSNYGPEGNFARSILDDGSINLSVRTSLFGDPVEEISDATGSNTFTEVLGFLPLANYGCAIKAGSPTTSQCVPVLLPNQALIELSQSVNTMGYVTDQRGPGFARASGPYIEYGAVEHQGFRLGFSPAEVRFGDQQIGTVSTPVVVEISNIGDSFRLSQFSVAGEQFQISSSTCPDLGEIFEYGEVCSLDIAFAPSQQGNFVGSIDFGSAGALALYGVGISFASDLVVESPDVSDTILTPGQNFTASATVRNGGTATSASTTLRYKYSTNSTIDASDQNIGSDPVSSLASGSTSPKSASVSIAQTGTFWVGACVDPVAGESSTTNNCSDGVRVRSEGPADHFVTTWQTDNPGVSGPTQITIPMAGGPYDVDWDNDGVFDQMGLTGPITHDFGAAGTYTVRIKGFYSSIQFDNSGDAEKILSIEQWGTGLWQTMDRAFSGARNLRVLASDTPDLAAVTDMFAMFRDTLLANPDTSSWNTSAVQGMGNMFKQAMSANPNTSGWDTSSVRSMTGMFAGAPLANPDTSSWDTSSVRSMRGMFSRAVSANPDTSGWDTSSVSLMDYMFDGATSANPDTSGWNTETVSTMRYMFRDAVSADPDTSGWDTSAVTSMRNMFQDAMSANPDTSNWDTSIVTDMSAMFANASVSNPNTSGWNTSSVTDMSNMFQAAVAADPDTSAWNTSAVTDMSAMFTSAVSADPVTSSWVTSAVVDMASMFNGATSANPDTSNWDTTMVTDMRAMFANTSVANPNTSGWNTSSVRDMSNMFQTAVAADPDTSNWDTAAVTKMSWMFGRTTVANPDTSSWNTSSVTNMVSMFDGAVTAKPNTSGWDTSAVTNMALMFSDASSADPDTSNWDTSSVTQMFAMFSNARAANPNTSRWDTSSVTSMSFMFEGAQLANPDTSGWDVRELQDARHMFGNSGLTTTSYEALLESWSEQSVQPDVSLGAPSNYYCSPTAGAARTVLTGAPKNWVISDRGPGCLLGGQVSGLAGTGLVLQNNGDFVTQLNISGNGTFTFPVALDDGSPYDVIVAVQPADPAQVCTVSGGTGTIIGAAVTDIQINCVTPGFTVGGTVNGLELPGLVLDLNGTSALLFDQDGGFVFSVSLAAGEDYNVTVPLFPADHQCEVLNGSGAVDNADIADVVVTCATDIEFANGFEILQQDPVELR